MVIGLYLPSTTSNLNQFYNAISANTSSFNKTINKIFNILQTQDYRKLIILTTNTTLENKFIESVNLHDKVRMVIDLSNVKTFNGKYHLAYNPFITIEESKIYILFINNMVQFIGFLHEIKTIYFWRSRDRVLVVVDGVKDLNLLQDIFEYCWATLILNIFFIFTLPDVSLWTYNPFYKNYSINLDSNQIFPDKTTNLMGHQLRISFFRNPVDAIYVTSTKYKGRDGFMADTIMKRINATCTYAPPADGIEYGLNLPTGVTGAIGDVANNVSDVALNSRFVKLEFTNIVEGTYPHDKDYLACLVPKTVIDESRKILNTFDFYTWVLTILAIILLTLSEYISALNTTRTTDVFNLALTHISIFTGVSYTNKFSKNVAIVSFLLSCFFLLAAFQSGITSIFTVPDVPDEINTFEELEASNLIIYTLPRFKDMLAMYGGDAFNKVLIHRFKVLDEVDLYPLISNYPPYAFIVKNTIASFYELLNNNFRDGRQHHRIMKSFPMPAIVCYIVRYGSPYLQRINIIVGRTIEHGLHDKWKAQTLHEIYLNEYGFRSLTSDNPKALTIINLKHLFLILPTGLSLAVVVFVLEIMYNWWLKKCSSDRKRKHIKR